MFKNIGRIGIEMYLLFQHHTTLELLRNVSDDRDLFTITGTGWHFVKFLGPAVAAVGMDTRSERNPHQVMAGPTYQGLFPKMALLPPTIQHCLLLISVPLIYPRLDAAEQIAHTMATGKKAVTGAYNVLGKVTSSVAGVVGAKGAVGSGFDSVKRAVGKSGLMGGILNPFGDIDVLDELKDMWTHESKVSSYLVLLTIHVLILPGSRAHLSDSHAPGNLSSEVHSLHLHLWRRQHVRSRSSPRPITSVRPQDHVPTDILVRCQHCSTRLCDEAPQQQQTTVHSRERATLNPFSTDRHKRGHDGDLYARRDRPAHQQSQADAPPQLRRHRSVRPRSCERHFWPDRHESRVREVEPGGGLPSSGRGCVWECGQVWAGGGPKLGVWALMVDKV